MSTRMALVAATESSETPWQRARGSEKEVVVRGLGKGEVILLDFEIDRQLQVPVVFESNGRFPFPQCSAFRVRKQTNGGPASETYVEIEVT